MSPGSINPKESRPEESTPEENTPGESTPGKSKTGARADARPEQDLARVIRRSLAEFGERRMTPDLQRRIVDRAVALYAIRDELV